MTSNSAPSSGRLSHEARPDAVVRAASGAAALRALAADIKIAHSVFAMPFALLAAFMARSPEETWPRFIAQLALVVGCMIAARTAAMLANRILDRRLDAANPRTNKRALASGRVMLRDAVALWGWSAAAFLALTAVFGFAFDNWWPFLLAIPLLVWICAYPLLKRITWLCHLYLGSSLAISPIAAAIAIRPEAITTMPALWLMSGMVLAWVAGFDVIYALQDLDVDRNLKLRSIPARFGYREALWVSRILHLTSIACLAAMLSQDARLRTIWFAGAVGLVVVLLLVEHAVTARHGTGRIQLTFFTLNGIISCLLGLAGIISIFGDPVGPYS